MPLQEGHFSLHPLNTRALIVKFILSAIAILLMKFMSCISVVGMVWTCLSN